MATDTAHSDQDKPAKQRPAWAQGVYDQLERGKAKQAVESAKTLHKEHANTDSERVLVDAYLGRIRQLQEKGAGDDARTLLQLVHDRFPAHRPELGSLQAESLAQTQHFSELLKPLADSNTPEATRLTVERAIQHHVTDLQAIANCTVLPETHPLRQGARAIWQAFVAVTSGSVTDEQIALPEISRRSPLAAWKLLIRAIAAMYRQDNQLCLQALDAIPTDTPPARLVPVIRGVVDRTKPSTGAAGELHMRVLGDEAGLRAALAECDAAIKRMNLARLSQAIRAAIQKCDAVRPEFSRRLVQHIFARCTAELVPTEDLSAIFDKRLQEDAYFFRLMAHALMLSSRWQIAAIMLHRFAVAGIAEGMFPANGPAVAAIYTFAADRLAEVPPEQLDDLDYEFGGAHYTLGDTPMSQLLDATDPDWLYRKAVEADADETIFVRWWNWGRNGGLDWKEQEDIADLWHERHPKSVAPLLHLVNLAESRKAYKLAMTRLNLAESLDTLNPAVRRARARLVLSTLWRHAKEHKPHLARQDLAALRAIPTMREGDSGNFLDAIEAALYTLEHDSNGEHQSAEKVYAAAGELVGELMLMMARAASGMPVDLSHAPQPKPLMNADRDVASAAVRLHRLAKQLGIALIVPRNWDQPIDQLLRANPCPFPLPDILTLAEAAAMRNDQPGTYRATVAGLRTATAGMAARFLLLRARSLDRWFTGRIAQCLLAARELAQQSHNQELMNAVASTIGAYRDAIAVAGLRGKGIDEDLLNEILTAERNATRPPQIGDEPAKHVVLMPAESQRRQPMLPFGGDDDWDDEEEVEDEKFEDDEFGDEDADDEADLPPLPNLPRNIPRSAIPVLQEIMNRFGRIPPPGELTQKDPALAARLAAAYLGINIHPDEARDLGRSMGNMGKRKKRRRH